MFHFNFPSECHTSTQRQETQRKHAKFYDPPLKILVQRCVKQI